LLGALRSGDREDGAVSLAPIEFGLRIPPCESPRRVAAFAAELEQSGFDYAWFSDSQLVWRDVWVTLGAAGMATTRIRLGTAVTTPATRHVTVTASAAAAMDELSDRRFILGLGAGDSAVRVMGGNPASLAEMREYIALLRRLWRGEFVVFNGNSFHLKGAPGRPIPIFVSASGPKMLEFAGEYADGVHLLAGVSSESLDFTLSHLDAGVRRADRPMRELTLVTGAYCHVGKVTRDVLRLVQPHAALFALRRKETLSASGIVVPPVQAISGIYPDLNHAEDLERAIEATNWVPESVLEEFAEKYCLLGTADEIAAKIARIAKQGVVNIYLRGLYSYELPHDLLASFSREVIPRFRSTTAPLATQAGTAGKDRNRA